MSRFTYTAQKTGGEVYQGVADVKDRFELYQVIRREGGKLLHLSDESTPHIWSTKYWDVKLSRISEQSKIMMVRNIGSMLSAGLSLSRALSVAERQAKNPRLHIVIAQLGSDVRRGNTLHSAFEKFPKIFPQQLIAMIRAGEESGDLSSSLKLAADSLDRAHTLKKKVRGAMIYPCIVITVIIAIGILMMIFVVPTLTATFAQSKAKLPFSTTVIIGISDALSHHTLLTLLVILCGGAGIYSLIKWEKVRGARSWLVLHMPMIGEMTREVNAARTARSLSSLVSSGVDVITALDITHDILPNVYFQAVIADAKKAVADGEPLSATFIQREDLFPVFVGEMMAVGEETGQTTDMLKNLAMFYEDEVDRKTKDMSTIIEPLLMIFIGMAVGFFAVSMIAPIYQVTQTIG